MPKPVQTHLLALARALPTVSTSSTLMNLLDQKAPGLLAVKHFFEKWLNLDITALALALGVLGSASAGIGEMRRLGSWLWRSVARFFVASICLCAGDKLNQDVMHWMRHHVITRQEPQALTASTLYGAENNGHRLFQDQSQSDRNPRR
ncbi:Uu.00g010560.m01.CDS01 [Anthostomella pinea]|uniref:Uu.00g010560.m01.CDS01 n=1 Tax=Anthostomella pinea TaxID=933095 RepID=A0AAI8VXL0_9PEZI|nr:Uu.00g010560.m01.CDS01 [Anthostomella pinea]